MQLDQFDHKQIEYKLIQEQKWNNYITKFFAPDGELNVNQTENNNKNPYRVWKTRKGQKSHLAFLLLQYYMIH